MSYAVHPAARVASKNGERRYHGPKYRVALFSSISGRSLVTVSPFRRAGAPYEMGIRFAGSMNGIDVTVAFRTPHCVWTRTA
jgi:hypothetical protein